jgi:cellulose synthase/poly-beta-1,6-N-acetylglucosamine synthase-like glycosyltransferase
MNPTATTESSPLSKLHQLASEALIKLLGIYEDQRRIQKGLKEVLISSPFPFFRKYILSFSNPEHLGGASWADTLICWFAILHRDSFRILHFLLGFTFHTISLH